MEEGGTGGANVKAESTREDPRATPGLVSTGRSILISDATKSFKRISESLY